MSTAGPPLVIDGPFPVTRPNRLLDVATIVDDPDVHWRAGGAVYPYPPDLPFTWNPCVSSTSPSTKQTGGVIPLPVFGAFQVYLAETCQAKGIGLDQQRFIDRATAVFGAVESFGVELEFVSGVALHGDSPYLADAEMVALNSGAATESSEALALLEKAIGETGRGGVIHATPETIIAWARDFIIYEKAGLGLVTPNGTRVVSGTGYIGAHPVGQAVAGASQAWAFATGPVQIRRGGLDILPGTVKEALNRETNEITYRVERDYLVDWDTVLQAGVLVDRTR